MPEPITPSPAAQRTQSTQQQPNMSASSSPQAKPPLSLLETQSAELTRLATKYTLIEAELRAVAQERDQALELVKSSQQALTSSRQALTASEELLRADDLIEFWTGHWIRPSAIRDVKAYPLAPVEQWVLSGEKWVQAINPDGKPKLVEGMRIQLNGDERFDVIFYRTDGEAMLKRILKTFIPQDKTKPAPARIHVGPKPPQ